MKAAQEVDLGKEAVKNCFYAGDSGDSFTIGQCFI